MWHLIPTILYLTYGEAHSHPANYPVLLNNERAKPGPNAYAINPGPAPNNYIYNMNPRQHTGYTGVPNPFPNNYPPQKLHQYVDDPYYNGAPYNKIPSPNGYNSRNGHNLGWSESQSQSRSAAFGSEPYTFDLDYDLGDSDTDTDLRNLVDGQSYFEDLELVDNFGDYLKRRTRLDGSSSAINDAAHQYNALYAVLLALARAIRNSCTADFDEVYDQVYLSTVDTYYKYGLKNPEKVAVMVEDYIRKGNSHIPKLRKLQQDHCEKEFCSLSFDKKIKSSPVFYVKELETLDALAHLARSYFSHLEEFNQAAQKGNVLLYLQNSKESLREYVMQIVNSEEHLTDTAVRCS